MDTRAAKLSFHIDGPDRLKGNVTLSAFLKKLGALRSALFESDHIVSGSKKASVECTVVDLSHSSPAMVGLELSPLHSDPGAPQAVVRFFCNTAMEIRSHARRPSDATDALIEHLQELVQGVGDTFQSLWIEDEGGPRVSIDVELQTALQVITTPTRRSYGSVKGVVRKYNSASERPSFRIFLAHNDHAVTCYFPDELIVQAAAAVEHAVTVSGDLKYLAGYAFPHEVAVKNIRVHKRDAELQTLSSLFGAMPRITGEQSVADFLSEARNDW